MKKIKIDKNQIKVALYNSILFSGLKEAHINKTADIIQPYFVSKKEKIVLEQQKGKDVFIVISGKIQVYFENKRKRVAIKQLCVGDVFGEIGFFIKCRAANCEALEDSIIGIIKYKDFSNLLYRNKEMLMNIIKILIAHILETDKEVKNLAFMPVLNRVVFELLTLTKDSDKIDLNVNLLSQKVVASRETVSRVLSLLEKIEVIKHLRNKIVVLNREKLHSFLR